MCVGSPPLLRQAAGIADYLGETERLADLRDRGIISSEDLEPKKEQLLSL